MLLATGAPVTDDCRRQFDALLQRFDATSLRQMTRDADAWARMVSPTCASWIFVPAHSRPPAAGSDLSGRLREQSSQFVPSGGVRTQWRFPSLDS